MLYLNWLQRCGSETAYRLQPKSQCKEAVEITFICYIFVFFLAMIVASQLDQRQQRLAGFVSLCLAGAFPIAVAEIKTARWRSNTNQTVTRLDHISTCDQALKRNCLLMFSSRQTPTNIEPQIALSANVPAPITTLAIA